MSFRRLEGTDSIEKSFQILHCSSVFQICVNIIGFFRVVEFVVEFGVAVAPLDVAPTIGADGLAVFVAAASDESEGGVAAFCRGIFQEWTERLAGEFMRGSEALVIGDCGIEIDKFHQRVADGPWL